MILTPASLPLFLTSWLWEPSQRLTALEKMRSLLAASCHAGERARSPVRYHTRLTSLPAARYGR